MAVHGHKHQEHHHAGLITRLAHDIVVAYDWLSGPAMSERDRMKRDLAEARHDRHLDVAL